MSRWDGKKVNWANFIGMRCIVVRDSWISSEIEVSVLEVSPSGKRVKFKFPSGAENWEDSSGWLLIEKLV